MLQLFRVVLHPNRQHGGAACLVRFPVPRQAHSELIRDDRSKGGKDLLMMPVESPEAARKLECGLQPAIQDANSPTDLAEAALRLSIFV